MPDIIYTPPGAVGTVGDTSGTSGMTGGGGKKSGSKKAPGGGTSPGGGNGSSDTSSSGNKYSWLGPALTLGGSLASSKGSKKAAKSAKPQIPDIFKPQVSQGLGVIGQRLSGGFPAFPGGAINPLQSMAMDQMGQSFGAGQAGLQSAQNTIQSIAGTGIDPNAINTAQSTLAPYFDFLRNQGLAATREGQAAGGRFYGSGGTNAEALFNSSFAANQAQQILPLAMQMTGMRLGAAGALPGFLGGQQQLGMNLFNVGGQAQSQQLAEFLRQQPETAIPLLAQLMGGTPLFQPPVASNFSQVLGSNINSALGSGGFWDYLRSIRQGPTGGQTWGNTPITGGHTFSDPNFTGTNP